MKLNPGFVFFFWAARCLLFLPRPGFTPGRAPVQRPRLPCRLPPRPNSGAVSQSGMTFPLLYEISPSQQIHRLRPAAS
jgi:hypothetical protein